MKKYCHYVKEKLNSIINEMEKSSESFVKNPGKDFVKNRKLSFQAVMKLLLSVGGNTIYKELLDYFKFDINTATASAFVQQRSKILPDASEYLFKNFTSSIDYWLLMAQNLILLTILRIQTHMLSAKIMLKDLMCFI